MFFFIVNEKIRLTTDIKSKEVIKVVETRETKIFNEDLRKEEIY